MSEVDNHSHDDGGSGIGGKELLCSCVCVREREMELILLQVRKKTKIINQKLCTMTYPLFTQKKLKAKAVLLLCVAISFALWFSTVIHSG